MELWLIVVILVASVGFSAFFSSSELAFVYAGRAGKVLLTRESKSTSQLLEELVRPETFITIALMGNNIMLVLYGWCVGKLFEPVLAHLNIYNYFISLLIETLVGTAVIVVLGEYLPKRVAFAYPQNILPAAVPIFKALYVVFYPVVALVQRIVRVTSAKNQTSPLSQIERIDFEIFLLQQLKHSSNERKTSSHVRIVERALRLGEKKLKECMIPRGEIIGVEENTPVEELINTFLKHRRSRIIVYRKNVDNIVGYVHFTSLFDMPSSVQQVKKPILILPETMSLLRALEEFYKNGESIACVVDEYGAAAGIVTVEDIIEEVTGELEDEYDRVKVPVEKKDKNTLVVGARAEVDWLNETYALGLPEGDYETLGGLVVSRLGRIPAEGEEFVIDRFKFKILKAKRSKIETIQITMLGEAGYREKDAEKEK